MYDLVIHGGTVVTCDQRYCGRNDVAISNSRIVEIAPELSALPARQWIDAGGALVTPGLFDMHSHIYPGVTALGMDVGEVTFPGGVTATADAGSTGSETFTGFRRLVVDATTTRVYAFVNLSRLGMTGISAVGELHNHDYADPVGLARTLRENADVAIGIKIRVSAQFIGGSCLELLRTAGNVAHAQERPLYVHIGESVESIDEIIAELRAGDIVTHCQTAKPGGLVDERLRVHTAVRQARDRGILFDSGHGRTHFDFDVARALLDDEFPPDTISSDVSANSFPDLRPGLLTVLNKWVGLGMSETDAILACTARPAAALVPDAGIGQLAPGLAADVAVLGRESGHFVYTDAAARSLTVEGRLVPRATVRAGRVVWKAGPQPSM